MWQNVQKKVSFCFKAMHELTNYNYKKPSSEIGLSHWQFSPKSLNEKLVVMLTVEQTVIPELFIVMEHSCCVVTLSVALVSGSLPLYVQMFKQQMVSLWFHAYHNSTRMKSPLEQSRPATTVVNKSHFGCLRVNIYCEWWAFNVSLPATEWDVAPELRVRKDKSDLKKNLFNEC